MPLNDRRIIQIIIEQCSALPNRCEGYLEEIVDVVAEVLAYERQHRVSATSIQKQISNKCDAAGRFLASSRANAADETED